MDLQVTSDDGAYVVYDNDSDFRYEITSVDPEMVESGRVTRRTAMVNITREGKIAFDKYRNL